MRFTESAAKEFIVDRIIDEAGRRGIPLSDVDRRMLFFSETRSTLPDAMDVADAFNREYDGAVYERKIADLLRDAHNRTAISQANEWSAAIQRLKEGDHYLSVLLDQAKLRPRGDWWRLLTAAVAVFGLGLLIVSGVGWLIGPEWSRDRVAFYAWVIALASAAVYTATRWVFGGNTVDGLIDEGIALVTERGKRSGRGVWRNNPGIGHPMQHRGREWAEYRRRNRLHWTVILVGLPLSVAIGFAAMAWLETEVPFYTLVPLCMAAAVITGMRVSSWRCPRCQRPFFATRWYRNTWTDACGHCGLPKWK